MQQGVEGFRAEDFLAPDKIHPNDRGHGYVAQLLARFLQCALAAEEQRQLAEAWRAQWEHQRTAAAQGAAGRRQADRSAAGLLAAVQPPADRVADGQAAANAAAGSAAIASAVKAADTAAGAAAGAASGGGTPALHTRFATADALALPPPMLAGAEALVAELCVRDRVLMIAVDANSSSGFRQVMQAGLGLRSGWLDSLAAQWKDAMVCAMAWCCNRATVVLSRKLCGACRHAKQHAAFRLCAADGRTKDCRGGRK